MVLVQRLFKMLGGDMSFGCIRGVLCWVRYLIVPQLAIKFYFRNKAVFIDSLLNTELDKPITENQKMTGLGLSPNLKFTRDLNL